MRPAAITPRHGVAQTAVQASEVERASTSPARQGNDAGPTGLLVVEGSLQRGNGARQDALGGYAGLRSQPVHGDWLTGHASPHGGASGGERR